MIISMAAILLIAQPPEGGPLGYVAGRASNPPAIDGKLDDPAWQAAPWSSDFVDIEGTRKPLPRFRTRAKMLWDDDYFYIAAQLEEPHLWAKLTQHDAVIFQDPDFEVFLDPDGDNQNYDELELNALNTTWDLFLPKAYRDGGPAQNERELAGLKSAVALDGTLNDPRDIDNGWTVEIAIPWKALEGRSTCDIPPNPATTGASTFLVSSGSAISPMEPTRRCRGFVKTTGSGRRRAPSTCTSPSIGASCSSLPRPMPRLSSSAAPPTGPRARGSCASTTPSAPSVPRTTAGPPVSTSSRPC